MGTKNFVTGAESSRSTGLKGWSVGGWIKGNYKTLKEAIKVGVPFLVANLASVDPIWTIIVTALGKLGLDVLDYYFPQV